MLDVSKIRAGNLVDFGLYGQLYVCYPDFSENWFWVTDSIMDRINPKAMGWSIRKSDAKAIMQSYKGIY